MGSGLLNGEVPALEAAGVRCWLYDVSELYDDTTFSMAMGCLPWEERRQRARRYRFKKDQCLCLGAGLLVAYALKKMGVRDLSLGSGEWGKPYLLRYPHIHFNLSHSGTMVACAVASEPVGVDVEERHAYDEGVARLCFTIAERHWMMGQPNVDEAFVRLWVRKESYLKLLGTGLTDDVRAFDVTPGLTGRRNVQFSEREQGGHTVCVCAESPARVTFETMEMFPIA